MPEPAPVDTVAPWTIKALSTATREAIRNAAKQENLTVGQWLEKRVNEWLADGSPVHVNGAAANDVRSVFGMVADMGRAGVPVQKGVAALLNRLAKRELRLALAAPAATSLPAIGAEPTITNDKRQVPLL